MSPFSTVIAALEHEPERLQDNWCVPPQAGRFLQLMALTAQAQRIAELGTSIGYSTLWLAHAAQQTGGMVNTVDADPNRQGEARVHVERAGLTPFVQFHTGSALGLLAEWAAQDKRVDLVFIDASKREYLAYFKQLESMLPPGGLVIADNTQSHREEMLDFLAYTMAHPGFDTCELDTPNGMLVARKKRTSSG